MALSDNNPASPALVANLRGAGLMVVATGSYAINDMLIKLLAGSVPLSQVIAVRGALTALLVALVAWRLGALTFRLGARDWTFTLARGAAEAMAAFFFLTALFHLPLGEVTAIIQAIPLAVALAGSLFLGEKVGWRRYIAIFSGFAGVMLIVRPGSEAFSVFALFALAAVLFATARDLCSRVISPAVPSLTVTFWTTILVMILGLLLSVSSEPWVQMDPRVWTIMIASSGFLLVAYLTIIMAMRVGEVGFVAPFRYAGLVIAMILGIIVFAERPDALTYLGSAIVVASGLYALWRERRRASA